MKTLREAGHEVWYVADEARGLTDDDVLRRAGRDGAVLLTSDKDFGELVFRQGMAAHGVLLLRLAGVPAAEKAELVVQAIEAHGAELKRSFSVLSRSVLRVRKPATPE